MRTVITSFVLCLCLTHAAGSAQAQSPETEARLLLLSLADAAQSASDCEGVVKGLRGVIQHHREAIERLASAEGPSSGTLNFAEEAKVAALAQTAVRCQGTPGAAKLAAVLAPLAPDRLLTQPQACNCSDWCPSGWNTWVAVAAASAACLGGSNISCCEATSWASYNACINTYCPSNECCSGVPVSVPPPPI
ncbi:MAG: hypothetical protein AAGM22_14585 [Acidobacteriota bacterium]